MAKFPDLQVAAPEGLRKINRRTFLQAVGGTGLVAGLTLPPAVGETYYTPEDRLLHHLLMAGQVMDEMVPENDSRWLVTLGGKAPFDGRFINAHRFHLMPDPQIKGLMIEQMHEIVRWQS